MALCTAATAVALKNHERANAFNLVVHTNSIDGVRYTEDLEELDRQLHAMD